MLRQHFFRPITDQLSTPARLYKPTPFAQSTFDIEQRTLRLIDTDMDKEISDLLDEIYADVQRYEQQQRQHQEPVRQGNELTLLLTSIMR